MKYVVLIIGMSLVTYFPRVLPSLFMDRIHLSKRFELFLQLIPYTAMSALIFPNVLYVDKHISVGLMGALCAFVCAWKKIPTILVVIISILVCLSVKQFGI